MDTIISSLFEGSLSSRLPVWALTIAFIMLILKYTGTLERMAKFLSSLLLFVKERETFDAEQERWAAEREAELEEVHANAAVQAQAAKQLSDQRAQQRLYQIVEQTINFLQDDFKSKIMELSESHVLLCREVSDMKVVASQAKESLLISHTRLDGIAALVPQIAQNFNELKPHLVQLSRSSKGMQTTVKELEGAIRLLVETMTNE